MSDVCLLCYLWTNQIFRCYFPHFLFCFLGAYWLSVFVDFSPLHLYPPFLSSKKKKKKIFTFLYSPALFPLSSVLPAVEGQWLEWGPWSRCSVTCNTGTQQRQRRCSSSVHGWAECKGLHQESRECTNPSCGGEECRSMLCIQTHTLSKKNPLCKHGKCIWSHLHGPLLNLVPDNSVAICWRRPSLACVWVSLYPAGPK